MMVRRFSERPGLFQQPTVVVAYERFQLGRVDVLRPSRRTCRGFPALAAQQMFHRGCSTPTPIPLAMKGAYPNLCGENRSLSLSTLLPAPNPELSVLVVALQVIVRVILVVALRLPRPEADAANTSYGADGRQANVLSHFAGS